MQYSTFQASIRISTFSIRQSVTTLLLLLTLLLLILSQTATASATQTPTLSSPPIVWQREFTFGDWENTFIRGCMIQTSDGGYAMAGQSGNIFQFNTGPWLVKFDHAGNQQWSQTYFSESLIHGYVNSLVQTPDGGYTLGGDLVVKVDSHGNIQWKQSYANISHAQDLIVTSDGGFAVLASLNGKCWLGKLDSLGKLQWNQTYASNASAQAISLVQTSDSGYAMLGLVNPGGANSQAWLIKTDASGKITWSQTYGWPWGYFNPGSFIQTNDGGFTLAAGLNGSLCLVKTDSIGNVLWNQTYSEFGFGNLVYSVIKTSDGGYALGSGFPNPDSTGSLLKLDATGNLQWNMTFNGMVCSIVQTNDGQYTFSVSSNQLQELISTDPATGPSTSPTPTPTSTLTPTPLLTPTTTSTVPEFSGLAILPLFLSILFVAAIIKHRKTRKQTKYRSSTGTIC
jgi:hypothetical protein